MKINNPKWQFVLVEVCLADAMERAFCSKQNLGLYGVYIRRGWGNSPKQAFRNAYKNVTTKGNVNLSVILADYAYFNNGKKIIGGDSPELINNDGSLKPL